MIIQEFIKIKVAASTINYWKNLGYCNISVGQIIYVKPNELSKKSNVIVECQCSLCSRKYQQRFSRNTDVCGYCLTSNRMIGNKLGKGNTRHTTPEKEDLLRDVKSGIGKMGISKKYSVSIPVVSKWLKEHDIDLAPYYGKKFFKTDDEKKEAISKIQKENVGSVGISELSRIVNVPTHIINKLRSDGDIQITTQFDFWNDSYSGIIGKLKFYAEENKKKNLKTIADENNISIEQLKRAFRENNIPVRLHSYNKSKGELECLDFIKSLGESCYSAVIDKTFEIDCYVPKKSFGVEYCGEYWHRYIPSKNNKYYHKNKVRFARERGISVLTIFESEWIMKQDIVKSMIRSKLGHSKRLYARKCSIREIKKLDAEQFHDKNHISSYANSSINIGLFHENTLVSVLSLIKSRFDKNHEYEISRFSTLCDHTVVGGLSRMFSYFVRQYDPESCMTYSDLRVGEGKSYEKIGFTHIGETVPNYFYYHKNKKYLESRMRYQKHKLKSDPNYSQYKTEQQIMEESGYYIVYDCGSNKYSWIKK